MKLNVFKSNALWHVNKNGKLLCFCSSCNESSKRPIDNILAILDYLKKLCS